MQLENNNELLNYIKNSDSMAACSQRASQALSQLPLNSGCGNSSKSPIVLSKLLHLPLGLQESYNPPTIVYNALPYIPANIMLWNVDIMCLQSYGSSANYLAAEMDRV